MDMKMSVVSNNNNQTEQQPNPDRSVVDVKIDDLPKAKTCHQCRQKRTDLVGSCVTKKKNKTCPIKLCTKCLLNRYGEEAEVVALRDDWTCPKCRGICNCSVCMKNRGKNPTGILVHTAKKEGFSSVSKLLEADGSEKYAYNKRVKPEGEVVASPLILDQEVKVLNNCCSEDNAAVEESSPKKMKISDSFHEPEGTEKVLAVGESKETASEDIKRTKPVLIKKEEDQVEVKPPHGNSVISVFNIDLAPQDAGNVFQFLQFCSAFAEALDLRNGQAEGVIREILSGRSNMGEQYSTLTEMIIKLLSVISKDRGETSDCWFTAVGECLSRSEVQLEDLPSDMFEKGISQYEQLSSSRRLKLLNFLCDETLGTSVVRNFIDSQILETVERKKEAKEKLNAAKDKEKQLKKVLEDELADALKERDERDAIVSRIKAETKEAHSEMKKCKMQKKSQGSADALRTKAVELDDNGLVFWRLKWDNEEHNILLQDAGSPGEVCPHDKWSSFSSDQKPEIEKYISYIRKKRLQAKKKAKTIVTSLAASTEEQDSN